MSDWISREATIEAFLPAGGLDYAHLSKKEIVAILRALPAVQPDREHIAFSMWKAEADRAAPNVGKHRTHAGFTVAADAERERWLGLADAAIAIAVLRGGASPNEYERKVAQMKEDFPNGV